MPEWSPRWLEIFDGIVINVAVCSVLVFEMFPVFCSSRELWSHVFLLVLGAARHQSKPEHIRANCLVLAEIIELLFLCPMVWTAVISDG